MSTQYKQVVVRSEDAALLQEALRNIMHRKGLRVKIPSMIAHVSGDSGNFEATPVVLANTLSKGYTAYTTTGQTVRASIANTGRNIETGATVLAVPSAVAGVDWELFKADFLSKNNAWIPPTVATSGQNLIIRSGRGNAIVQGIAYRMHYQTSWITNQNSPYTVIGNVEGTAGIYPGYLETYARASVVNGVSIIASPMYRYKYQGNGSGITVNRTPGTYSASTTITLTLPSGIPSKFRDSYSMMWRRGTGSATAYTSPIPMSTLVGSSTSGASADLQVAIVFEGTTSSYTSKGTYTIQ